MGLVEMYDPVAKKDIAFHVPDTLQKLWKGLSNKVIKEDDDRVYVVVGQEGSGKSTFAFSQAKFIDPTFSIDRICFTPEQFLEQLKKTHAGGVVVFDEAFRGFSSKSTQSKVNKMLVQAMMEVRRMNLIIFIVLPSFTLLENYIAIHRSNALFYTYKRDYKAVKYRGWKAYPPKKKAEVYFKAKKGYGMMPKVKTTLYGKFFAKRCEVNGKKKSLPYETFDDIAYNKKKAKAFGVKEKNKDEEIVFDESQAMKIISSLPIKTKKDVAAFLGLSERTIYNIIERNTTENTIKSAIE